MVTEEYHWMYVHMLKNGNSVFTDREGEGKIVLCLIN
jgi:hypothetical protein